MQPSLANDAALLASAARIGVPSLDPEAQKAEPTSPTYMADFSLALINRTGAYHICRDLLVNLPQYFDSERYWRLRRQPGNTILRKLAGRAMTLELSRLPLAKAFPWPGPRPAAQPTLFMDPLYVLHADLKAQDIVICHDVGPITHPEFFGEVTARMYRQAYEKIARINPGVVTVSETTRKEYERLYGTNSRFIVTCRLYVRQGIGKTASTPVDGVDGPFLLTIGALEARKNYLRVFEAYRRSGLYERGVSYLFGGARGSETAEILKAASQVPGVRALGYVSDEQMRWLFRNASGMVLPSLLEGFGLPPLEAAQEGLVSMVSAGGAQEEAVDGAAILVDPYSVDSIAAGMTTLVDLPPAERAVLVARAQAHAASLSFERYIAGFDKILARNAMPAEPI